MLEIISEIAGLKYRKKALECNKEQRTPEGMPSVKDKGLLIMQ
jgi:hypothetical protein